MGTPKVDGVAAAESPRRSDSRFRAHCSRTKLRALRFMARAGASGPARTAEVQVGADAVASALKIIDVFICKLRKKLANASAGKNYIETVWGRGYVLREPHDDEAKIPA